MITRRFRYGLVVASFLAVLIALAGALGVSGLAAAQDEVEEEASTTGDAVQAPSGTEGEEGAEVPVLERANVTPAEQIEASEQLMVRGTQLAQRVAGMLDEARREGDIVRVTCLDDKLSQINANIGTLEQRTGDLRAAVDVGDSDEGNHQFTVVTVLGQKLETLEAEANQCIGQDLFYTGATEVRTTIAPNSPEENVEVLEDVDDPGAPFIPPPESAAI